MWQADNSCRIIERKGKKLLLGLVGDSLLEPFWPTGSGCAKGFFSCFDMCWMMKQFNSGKTSLLEIIVERESLFRILPQMTTDNIKNFTNYSLEPLSRYVNTNKGGFLVSDALALLDTDAPDEMKIILENSNHDKTSKKTSNLEQFSKQDKIKNISQLQSHDTTNSLTLVRQKLRKRESIMPEELLISWFKNEVSSYQGLSVNISSLKDGTVLCALLHKYRPHLIDFYSLDKNNVVENNNRAFNIFEKEFGIKPLLTGNEMLEHKRPNSFKFLFYLTQVQKKLSAENKANDVIKVMKIWSIEYQNNNQLNNHKSSTDVLINIPQLSPFKKEKTSYKYVFLILHAIQMVLSLAIIAILYMYNTYIIPSINFDKR
ncbi:unnamed protein product, partial [Meganyctiphanes norvegica]